MTDPTPEELDALVKELITMSNHPESKYARAAAAITALRAQLAETDALITAAYEAAAGECDAHALWIEKNGRVGIYPAEGVLRTSGRNIRALAKPGARTLLDQRIAEAEQVGYERGLREAGK